MTQAHKETTIERPNVLIRIVAIMVILFGAILGTGGAYLLFVGGS